MRLWCRSEEAAGRLDWPMWRLFRTGKKTDWKELVTKEQVSHVARMCRENFRENEERILFPRADTRLEEEDDWFVEEGEEGVEAEEGVQEEEDEQD